MSPSTSSAARHSIDHLRSRAISGTLWTVLEHGATQILRLIGNLLLTRILFPEAFGLMLMVQVVLIGLQMFSDIGINASVIRDRRGEEPVFLNTAWTMNCARGIVLWTVATIIAWPMAVIYAQPLLRWMIPLAGLTAMFAGFQAPAMLLLQRRVQARPILICRVTACVLGLLVNVVLALVLRSVWALVFGMVAYSAFECILTYRLLPGPRPRFTWDPESARVIYRFGRWIFFSTVFTFLQQQGDRAILGGMVSPAQLGIFGIAATLAQVVLEVTWILNTRVLFPVYSQLTTHGTEAAYRRIYKIWRALLIGCLPLYWLVILFGNFIVQVLYDDRYRDAGWMLQVLAFGTVGAFISQNVISILLAVGDSFRLMVVQAVRSVMLVLGMAIGGSLGGLTGAVVGIAVSKVVDYPVMAWAVRRHHLWMPQLDGLAFALTAAVACAALYLANMGG